MIIREIVGQICGHLWHRHVGPHGYLCHGCGAAWCAYAEGDCEICRPALPGAGHRTGWPARLISEGLP